ncbi:MAG: type II toxin-antitoxin system RelE/ParE family toxin [Pasteurellaceae bacterium]|nr:type II toxin-antitoxin system RelE/ParE family toxin [Pasteurellaceae bacterium]
MRIFKTKNFDRFARQQEISDSELLNAIERATQGLIDANLGGNLIKQRLSRAHSGKSSGYRSIILYQQNHHCFFLYGFAKNVQENISQTDLNALKMLGKQLSLYRENELNLIVEKGNLIEILGENDDKISK